MVCRALTPRLRNRSVVLESDSGDLFPLPPKTTIDATGMCGYGWRRIAARRVCRSFSAGQRVPTSLRSAPSGATCQRSTSLPWSAMKRRYKNG